MIDRLPDNSIVGYATGYAQVAHARTSKGLDASAEAEPKDDRNQSAGGHQHLSEEEKQQVQQLKHRDQEVRAHERAHLAAGAGVVQGGASFTLQRGPDGRMYAVGGEVKVDTSAESDPDQTIRKMQQVKQAALAPAEPSGTDQAVAARAGQVEAQARQEKNKLEEAGVDFQKPDDRQDRQAPGANSAMPGSRPYSAEAVGQSLNIAV
jgi:hypothetical protein